MSTDESQQNPGTGYIAAAIYQDYAAKSNTAYDHSHGKTNIETEHSPPQATANLAANNFNYLDTGDETPRGRLKRRRNPSHSPPRDSSPSRGHDRDSGSRHRRHFRPTHRRSSSSASITPPPPVHKSRRRSDAEPDHTLRGRARLRSRSRSRSPILEGEENETKQAHRKRSPPPSRHRSESTVGEGARRQRSLPNQYKKDLRKRGKMVQV